MFRVLNFQRDTHESVKANRARKRIVNRAVCGVVGLVAMVAAAPPLHAETLQEALAAAYESNPDLQAQRAALRATDETVNQALSGYRPTVQGTAQVGVSQTDSSASNPAIPDAVSTANFTSDDRFYQVQFTQPIFRGFQTYNSGKQARSNVDAGRSQLATTEQQTLLDAVTAYMDVLRDLAVVELNNNQVEVLRRQLEASQDRFRVGEITRTDVAQSEARLAAAVSTEIAAEATLTASREAYRRIIGRSPGSLEQPPPLPTLPESREEAIEIGLQSNPRLLAARYNEEAARYSVRQAQGTLLPSVQGVASFSRNEGAFGPATLQEANRKTASLQVSVPIYQSGSEYSQIRQAKQVRSQRMLEIASAERLVIESVSNGWEQYRSAIAQIVSNEQSVRANEIALDGVRQEAAVGSRTTLDVLDAEQELLDSRVNLVRAQRDEYVAGFTLLQAIGRLGAQDLNLDVVYYDPQKYLKRNKWRLFGWD